MIADDDDDDDNDDDDDDDVYNIANKLMVAEETWLTPFKTGQSKKKLRASCDLICAC